MECTIHTINIFESGKYIVIVFLTKLCNLHSGEASCEGIFYHRQTGYIIFVF